MPASGGVVAHFVGVQHVTLTCQLQNEDGSLRVTNWWKQTSQDRENGQERDFLLHDDRHFLLSGVNILTVFGNISDNSILTIVSLTEDLDTAIIFCGSYEPLANFTLRIYCKTLA